MVVLLIVKNVKWGFVNDKNDKKQKRNECMDLDFNNLNFNCRRNWSIFSSDEWE